jgi:hypothetical protein
MKFKLSLVALVVLALFNAPLLYAAGGVHTDEIQVKKLGGYTPIHGITFGTAVLSGSGTATVTTNKITANSLVFLTNNTLGGTAGFLRVSARTAGTSFVITSSSATDTSTVAWIIFEP